MNSKTKINVFIPATVPEATARVIEYSHAVFSGYNTQTFNTYIDPKSLGKNVSLRDELNERSSLPEDWKDSTKGQSIVKKALAEAKKADLVYLTGGADFAPELFGYERQKETQNTNIYDFRDVVELYTLLDSIANGKTVQGTCRGFQLIAVTMGKLANDSGIEYSQHLQGEHHQATGLKEDYYRLVRENSDGTDISGDVSPQLLEAMIKRKISTGSSIIDDFPNAASHNHEVTIADADSFASLVYGDKGYKITSWHHQGLEFENEEALGRFQGEIAKVGGKVTGISSHSKDDGLIVVENIDYSLNISEALLDRVGKLWEEVNNITGFDIEFNRPEISADETVCFDATTEQGHIELNGIEGLRGG